MRVLIGLTLLLVAPAANSDELAVPPGIPEVGSLEELEALDPFTRFEGWDLRIAMAPAAMPADPVKGEAAPDFSPYPWRILYADFRRIKDGASLPDTDFHVGDEPLGPLSFNFDFDPEGIKRPEVLIKEIERMRIHREESDHYLFAATLPTPGKGTYTVRVFPPSDREEDPKVARETTLFESKWKRDSEPELVWTQFARSQWVDLPNLGIPVPDKLTVPFIPHAPEFDGYQSLVSSDKIARKVEEKPKPLPIPGMLPSKQDTGFKISASGAGIAIRLEEPLSTDIENFLVRWWIDGEPVALTIGDIPERGLEKEPMEELKKQNEVAFTTRVPFQLPDALNGAGPDAKITLQMLYSPTGTKEIPNPHEMGMEAMDELREQSGASLLRLSNRLEFRLGDFIDT